VAEEAGLACGLLASCDIDANDFYPISLDFSLDYSVSFWFLSDFCFGSSNLCNLANVSCSLQIGILEIFLKRNGRRSVLVLLYLVRRNIGTGMVVEGDLKGGVVMGRLRDVSVFVVFCVLRLRSLRTGVFSGG